MKSEGNADECDEHRSETHQVGDLEGYGYGLFQWSSIELLDLCRSCINGGPERFQFILETEKSPSVLRATNPASPPDKLAS